MTSDRAYHATNKAADVVDSNERALKVGILGVDAQRPEKLLCGDETPKNSLIVAKEEEGHSRYKHDRCLKRHPMQRRPEALVVDAHLLGWGYVQIEAKGEYDEESRVRQQGVARNLLDQTYGRS